MAGICSGSNGVISRAITPFGPHWSAVGIVDVVVLLEGEVVDEVEAGGAVVELDVLEDVVEDVVDGGSMVVDDVVVEGRLAVVVEA
jgi:hypothetical protein